MYYLYVLLYFIAAKIQVLWLKCVIFKNWTFLREFRTLCTSCCLRDQGPPYSYLYFTALCIAISIEIPSMKWKKKDLLAPQWPYVCTVQYLCMEGIVLLMAGSSIKIIPNYSRKNLKALSHQQDSQRRPHHRIRKWEELRSLEKNLLIQYFSII